MANILSNIVPGDSGAWIYDPVHRQLCGHVLAWADKSKTAYIAPMEVLFDDIRRTLNADRVTLVPEDTPATETDTLSEHEEQEEVHARPNDQIAMARDIELALEHLDIGTHDLVDQQSSRDSTQKPAARSTTKSRRGTTLTSTSRSAVAATKKDVAGAGPAGGISRRSRLGLVVS